MASKMKHAKGERITMHFSSKIKLEFHGARLTSDGGFLPTRNLTKHWGDLFPRAGSIVTNISARAEGVVQFHNRRRIADQWIKEKKYALNWTTFHAKHFLSNQVRLSLFVLAYNQGNFLRRMVLPGKLKHWSLQTLLVKLIKIGARILRRSRYITFQMAEVAISKEVFVEILSRIYQLRCCSLQ